MRMLICFTMLNQLWKRPAHCLLIDFNSKEGKKVIGETAVGNHGRFMKWKRTNLSNAENHSLKNINLWQKTTISCKARVGNEIRSYDLISFLLLRGSCASYSHLSYFGMKIFTVKPQHPLRVRWDTSTDIEDSQISADKYLHTFSNH